MKFAEVIANLYGQEAAKATESAYDQLLLPFPNHGEYYSNRRVKAAFITDFAVVVRLRNNHRIPLLRSKHILRPVGSIRLSEELRLDIQPAGHIADTKIVGMAAYTARTEEGLSIDDPSYFNYAFFKKSPYGRFPGDCACLNFDPGAVWRLNNRVREIKDMLNGSRIIIDLEPLSHEERDFQDEFFSDLRAAFNASHDPKTDTLIPEKVIEFWRAMAAAKEDFRLATPWVPSEWRGIDHSADVRGVPQIAKNYSRHLRKHSPIFRGFKAA